MTAGHPSDAATRLTLARMRQLSRDARAAGEVIAAARGIVADVRARDVAGQMRALRAWLAARVRFVPDPLGVELLDDPRVMLGKVRAQGYVQGDCDAAATLGAALALAVGIPARFVAVAFNDAGAPYQHVYAELVKGRAVLELDVTRPAQTLPLRVSRTLTLPV